MNKIIKWSYEPYPNTEMYFFFCPGCRSIHPIHVKWDPKEIEEKKKFGDVNLPTWKWNGSLDKPTFNPSLLVNKSWPDKRCHSFIIDGNIQFLNDCWHNLKGQTIPIPDWKDNE
jgi:hypothetical protein